MSTEKKSTSYFNKDLLLFLEAATPSSKEP